MCLLCSLVSHQVLLVATHHLQLSRPESPARDVNKVAHVYPVTKHSYISLFFFSFFFFFFFCAYILTADISKAQCLRVTVLVFPQVLQELGAGSKDLFNVGKDHSHLVFAHWWAGSCDGRTDFFQVYLIGTIAEKQNR